MFYPSVKQLFINAVLEFTMYVAIDAIKYIVNSIMYINAKIDVKVSFCFNLCSLDMLYATNTEPILNVIMLNMKISCICIDSDVTIDNIKAVSDTNMNTKLIIIDIMFSVLMVFEWCISSAFLLSSYV